MRASNSKIFNNAVMVSNFTCSPVSLFNIFGYSIQLVFVGSPVGTFNVYVSDDPNTSAEPVPPQPTNWTLLADSSLSVSAAGNIMYNVNEVNYNWVYVEYVFTSGSGVCNGRINLKGF